MMKKTLYSVLFIALAVGTYYSYQQVGFARKTAMFFQVVFGDETAMEQGHGGPRMGGNMQQGQARFQGPGGNGGPGGGGHGGSGATVSLSKVGMFTVIMAFVVMLTCFLDNWFRNFSRMRRSRKTKHSFPLTV